MCFRLFCCGHQEWMCLTASPGCILAPSIKLVFVHFAWVILEKPKLAVNMITLLMLMPALWTCCYIYKYPYHSTIIETLYTINKSATIIF